jgi:hypothetical protein
MRCRGLHRLANPLYLKGFLFPALPSVAPYCVPGGVKVVSVVQVAFYRLAGSARLLLAVDLSPLLLSIRRCGNKSPPFALRAQALSTPYGDEERAPPNPKPSKVLEVSRNSGRPCGSFFSANRSLLWFSGPNNFRSRDRWQTALLSVKCSCERPATG